MEGKLREDQLGGLKIGIAGLVFLLAGVLKEGSRRGGWSELPGRKAAWRAMLGSSAVQLVLRQPPFVETFTVGRVRWERCRQQLHE